MEHLDKERMRLELLQQMHALVKGPVNDVVKLSFLGEDNLGSLDHLNLSTLAEFKRSDKGSVEMKFINRVEVLEKLIHLLDDSGQKQAEAFFQALEQNRVDDPSIQSSKGASP